MRFSEKRWSEISKFRRLARWVAYVPSGYAVAVLRCLVWVGYGCRPMEFSDGGPNLNHRQTLGLIWNVQRARTDFRLGRWKSGEELIAELTAKAGQ